MRRPDPLKLITIAAFVLALASIFTVAIGNLMYAFGAFAGFWLGYGIASIHHQRRMARSPDVMLIVAKMQGSNGHGVLVKEEGPEEPST